MTKNKEIVKQKGEVLYILIDYSAGQDRYLVLEGKESLVYEMQEQFVKEYDSSFDNFINWIDNETEIFKIENGQVYNIRKDFSNSIEDVVTIKINY